MPISGKRKWGVPFGHRAPLRAVSPLCDINISSSVCNNNRKVSVLANNNKCGLSKIVVAAVRSQGAVVKGGLGDRGVDVMMDSGSSISLVMESFVKNSSQSQPPPGLKLISAAGEPIP